MIETADNDRDAVLFTVFYPELTNITAVSIHAVSIIICFTAYYIL